MEHVRIPWNCWVVVCDGGKALVFRNDGDAELVNLKPLDILAQFDPPTRDLGTDRPGRVHESFGGSRSSVEETDLHAEAEAAFIAKLAQRLDEAVGKHEVTHLILVAPPKALGIFRKHMTPRLHAIIKAEVGKDLAQLSTAEIERHLVAA